MLHSQSINSTQVSPISKYHVGKLPSCSLSSIFCHHASSDLGAKRYTLTLATQGLASFLPLFIQTPCPPLSISRLPTESHEVSESSSITVFIYRQLSQDLGLMCVHVRECMCVCGWMGVSNSHYLKPGPRVWWLTSSTGRCHQETWRHLSWDRELLLPVTSLWSRLERKSARDCPSCRRLKTLPHFLIFLSVGQNKYVALHFVKTKVTKPQLFREPGAVQ